MLVGNRYIKETEPTSSDGTIAFGYQWLNSTNGNLYERNATNTAWVLVGNANTPNLGFLPLSGGAMTGAITGASGWAALESPALTGAPTKNGVEIATINDVSSSATNLTTDVQRKLQEAVASTTSAINVKSKIAFSTGILDFTSWTGTTYPPAQTIPLPAFMPDNIIGDPTQYRWIVTPVMESYPVSFTSGGLSTLIYSNGTDTTFVDPTQNLTFSAFVATNGHPEIYGIKVAYFVFGVQD